MLSLFEVVRVLRFSTSRVVSGSNNIFAATLGNRGSTLSVVLKSGDKNKNNWELVLLYSWCRVNLDIDDWDLNPMINNYCTYSYTKKTILNGDDLYVCNHFFG